MMKKRDSNKLEATPKLLYILNSYSDKDSSHFTHILHLLDQIASEGCDVTLIIEKATNLPCSSCVNIIALSLKQPGLRHIELFARIVALVFRGYRTTFVRIAAPAAIIASFANRLFGGRVFLWQSGTTHEIDLAQPWSLTKFHWYISSYFPNWLARVLVNRFVTGPKTMVDYYANVVGIPRKKITLLYNDVQLERFRPLDRDESRKNFLLKENLPASTVVMLLVHRLSPVRRTLMYLEPTFATLSKQKSEKEWLLIIAGGGSELSAAKILAKKYEISDRVRFLGDVPNREVAFLYGISNLFIHPTYTEGFPRVLIEAMAAKLPIVTTDAGGTIELLGPKQQDFVVSRDNPEVFAKKTLELLTTPEKWYDLASENDLCVERFSTDAVAKMYISELFS